MLDLPLFRRFSLRGVGGVVTIVLVAPGGRGFGQHGRTRNVEICEFSQKRIEALLLAVPIDLIVC
jgi:hypothetical protein